MTFSEAIKDVRKSLNITQTELANELEVSFSTINRWENNRTIPNKIAIKVITSFCKNKNIDFKYTAINITDNV